MQFQINFGAIVAVRLRARSELDFGNVSYVTALRSHDFFYGTTQHLALPVNQAEAVKNWIEEG